MNNMINDNIKLGKKLNNIKKIIRKSHIKKSGWNSFQKFYYYELDDFLPKITDSCVEEGIYTHYVLKRDEYGDKLCLDAMDLDTGFHQVIASHRLPPMTCGNNVMQDEGKISTYCRRYLWLEALDISENDGIDSNNPKKTTKQRYTGDKHENELRIIGNRAWTELKNKNQKPNKANMEALLKTYALQGLCKSQDITQILGFMEAK